MEIVGVVQSHKYLTVQEPPVATVYYPLEQDYLPRMTLAARVEGSPLAMVDPIARAIVGGESATCRSIARCCCQRTWTSRSPPIA